jgi:hypothetical protein
VNAADVLARLSQAFVATDWSAMSELYHPDALIVTVTGGPAPLTAAEVIAELRRATSDDWYLVKASEPQVLGVDAAIVTGRMRRRLPQGGFEDASHVWLLTVRDGLIYRQAVYGDPAKATAAYERLGVTLGVPDRQ